MKIGLAQTQNLESFQKNIDQCMDFLVLGSKLGLDILCFPEIHFSHFYPCQPENNDPFQWAEGIPGPTAEQFQKMAKELGMVVILNYMERFNHEFYNASPIIDSNGKLLGVSRMVHVPQLRGYYAQSYFAPSCGDFHVYKTEKGKVGVLVSYDRHFPEASRALALKDADIIFIPGYVSADQDLSVYKAELQTMAYQNALYVGMCNRVGIERGTEYIGKSMIVGPDGKIIVEGTTESALVVAEIDLEAMRMKKSNHPFLQLRRPDEYLHIIKHA